MSLSSWIKKFYPIKASQLKNASDLKCVKHALRKWKGAKSKNLKQHGVSYKGFIIDDTEWSFSFDSDSCSLCQKYHQFGPRNKYCYNKKLQKFCPISEVLGRTCDADSPQVGDSIFYQSQHNPKKMIKLLTKVRNKLRKEKHNS